MEKQSISENIKFTWEYFVQGKHRLKRKGRKPGADGKSQTETGSRDRGLHTDPMVGDFKTDDSGIWWGETKLPDWKYKVELSAVGEKPTREQMDRFVSLTRAIPQFVEGAQLGVDLNWILRRKGVMDSITLNEDGSAIIILEIGEKHADWIRIETSPDLKLVSAGWTS